MLDQDRFVVGDTAWEKVAPLLPGKPTDPGGTGKDNRLFLEAVLWRVRAGAPWRDLPSAFGKWNSVFQRFRRWVKGGVFERVFTCLSGEPGDCRHFRVLPVMREWKELPHGSTEGAAHRR